VLNDCDSVRFMVIMMIRLIVVKVMKIWFMEVGGWLMFVMVIYWFGWCCG